MTGGIGGVHRGGESSLDISADLTELGRTPVAVVCAGAKSVLDIPRTLEFLETQGVTVAAYQCAPPPLPPNSPDWVTREYQVGALTRVCAWEGQQRCT